MTAESLTLETTPGQKILELGGGQNRNPISTCNVDVRPGPGVDFTADFNEPLPIESEEWDAVFSQFTIEHLSWRKVQGFLNEVFRVIKPGGKCCFVTANVEAQVEYIKNHPAGWDHLTAFEAASCLLFGDQDYPENTHKNYMTPALAETLFKIAGFHDVITQPYGSAGTDMVVTATRPPMVGFDLATVDRYLTENGGEDLSKESPPHTTKAAVFTDRSVVEVRVEESSDPSTIFSLNYFDHYPGSPNGYYWDFPHHEIIYRKLSERRPQSVLELGCARGYILKRLQDAGIPAYGLDVSKHAYLTRVADHVILQDVTSAPWKSIQNDLCFSINFLEYISEDQLPVVLREMAGVCKRGLHAIQTQDDGKDPHRKTVKPRDWWMNIFNQHTPSEFHVEIHDAEEFKQGTLPVDYLQGDGKMKLNVGCFLTMFHHGWTNIDTHDLKEFASSCGYKYFRHDVRQGLPYGTAAVDLIYCAHTLDHFSYAEAGKFLAECRRVLKPEGALRIIVPDAATLSDLYLHQRPTPGCLHLSELDQVNAGCARATTPLAKLYAVLHDGHASLWDAETLEDVLKKAGLVPVCSRFRTTWDSRLGKQLLKETLDTLPCYSLYYDAVALLEE